VRRTWASAPTHHRVLFCCVAVQMLLVALNMIDRGANINLSLIDVETESSLTTWWTSFQFGLAGLASGAVAALESGAVWVWGPISGAMMLFSVDEVGQMHERFEGVAGSEWVVRAAEPIVAVAIFAFTIYALRRLGRPQRLLLVLAAFALLAANAIAAVNDTGATAASSWSEHLLGVQEELSEMLVGSFVLAAAVPLVLQGLRRHYAARPAASRSA
jgi:hypothetical protein